MHVALEAKEDLLNIRVWDMNLAKLRLRFGEIRTDLLQSRGIGQLVEPVLLEHLVNAFNLRRQDAKATLA